MRPKWPDPFQGAIPSITSKSLQPLEAPPFSPSRAPPLQPHLQVPPEVLPHRPEVSDVLQRGFELQRDFLRRGRARATASTAPAQPHGLASGRPLPAGALSLRSFSAQAHSPLSFPERASASRILATAPSLPQWAICRRLTPIVAWLSTALPAVATFRPVVNGGRRLRTLGAGLRLASGGAPGRVSARAFLE